jgi:hypothetical protein
MLAGLPGEVVWVEWNTVSTDAWARIEWHEAERLGRRSPDDLPSVYPERIAKAGHLICHSDIDRAKRILEELCGFCYTS